MPTNTRRPRRTPPPQAATFFELRDRPTPPRGGPPILAIDPINFEGPEPPDPEHDLDESGQPRWQTRPSMPDQSGPSVRLRD